MNIKFAWSNRYFNPNNWQDPTCIVLMNELEYVFAQGRPKRIHISGTKDILGAVDVSWIEFKIAQWVYQRYDSWVKELREDFEFTTACAKYLDHFFGFILTELNCFYFVSWQENEEWSSTEHWFLYKGKIDQIAKIEFKEEEILLIEEPVSIKECTQLIGWLLNKKSCRRKPLLPFRSISLEKLKELNPRESISGMEH